MERGQKLSIAILLLSLLTAVSAIEWPKPQAIAVYEIRTRGRPGEDITSQAIRILTSVVGSKKAAKKAIRTISRVVPNQFNAVLTVDQGHQLEKNPEVISVRSTIDDDKQQWIYKWVWPDGNTPRAYSRPIFGGRRGMKRIRLPANKTV